MKDPKEIQTRINEIVAEGDALDEIKQEFGNIIIGEGVPEASEKEFKQAKIDFEKAQIEFKERFRDYKPYDLSEIDKITKKAIEHSKKAKSREQKTELLNLAIVKIDQIINNSKSVYYYLEREGSINEPEVFWNELKQAENIKKKIEISIRELLLTEPQTTETPDDLKISEGSSLVKTSNTEPEPFTENMTSKQAAEYTTLSKRTIDKDALNGKLKSRKVGSRRIFNKNDLDDYINGKDGRNENPEIHSDDNAKKLHHFTFQVSLEPFTDVFIKEGYLDNDNAAIMVDRFSPKPKLGEQKIIWKGDDFSLVAFIYFTDCLGLWGKKPSDIKKQPFYSLEFEDKEKGVKYSTLALENFEVTGSSREWNKTTVNRARTAINEAFMSLCEKINERQNLSSNSTEEIDAKRRLSALKYYFKHKDTKHFSSEFNDESLKMLDITGEIIKKHQKKFETFLKLSSLL